MWTVLESLFYNAVHVSFIMSAKCPTQWEHSARMTVMKQTTQQWPQRVQKCFGAVVSWVAIITYSNTLLQLNNGNKWVRELGGGVSPVACNLVPALNHAFLTRARWKNNTSQRFVYNLSDAALLPHVRNRAESVSILLLFYLDSSFLIYLHYNFR